MLFNELLAESAYDDCLFPVKYMNTLRLKKYKFSIRLIIFVVIMVLLCQNIAWAQGERVNSGCLAAKSRLMPFFEKHELGVGNIGKVTMAAGRLKKLIFMGERNLDDELTYLNEFQTEVVPPDVSEVYMAV